MGDRGEEGYGIAEVENQEARAEILANSDADLLLRAINRSLGNLGHVTGIHSFTALKSDTTEWMWQEIVLRRFSIGRKQAREANDTVPVTGVDGKARELNLNVDCFEEQDFQGWIRRTFPEVEGERRRQLGYFVNGLLWMMRCTFIFYPANRLEVFAHWQGQFIRGNRYLVAPMTWVVFTSTFRSLWLSFRAITIMEAVGHHGNHLPSYSLRCEEGVATYHQRPFGEEHDTLSNGDVQEDGPGMEHGPQTGLTDEEVRLYKIEKAEALRRALGRPRPPIELPKRPVQVKDCRYFDGKTYFVGSKFHETE